jgi:hypothetical protein
MKIKNKDKTTIIKNTTSDINSFIENIITELVNFKSQNLIIDLTTTNVTVKDIKLFAEASKTHKKNKKSFVIVANDIDYNAVPTKISVVPSIQEANDSIEMEEIERDLGF